MKEGALVVVGVVLALGNAFGQSYRFSFAFGEPGSDPGQLQWPAGLFMEQDGQLFVADRYNRRIEVFDSKGSYLREFGAEQLIEASGVARDGEEGNLYVVDPNRERVQVFDGAGEFLFGFGEHGSGPGQFQTPLGVAVQSSGNVLVVDHFGRRIEVFDRDGNYLSELTAAGDRQFNNTWAVAVDGFDNIYVADLSLSECANVFDPSGLFLYAVGGHGEGDGECIHPHEIAVDVKGNVFISDGYPNFHNIERIQVFASDGTFLSTIGEPGQEYGQFNYAGGVTVDLVGNVFISDTEQSRIQVFAPSER